MGCFSTILVIVGGIFTVVSMIKWFEQSTEAVQNGWWNKVFVLLAMPFTVWFFPGRVSTGRPIPVPHHEPVRGFGSMPKAPAAPVIRVETPAAAPVAPVRRKKRSGIDPDQVAKLKQKM